MPLKLVDDAGRSVAVNAPAQRIVSLAPHVTEMLFAAGAGDRLVGVSAFSDYPAAAKKIPLIGGYGKIDIERILALRPDLIIGWKSGNSAADIAGLERLGIPLFLTEPGRLEDIPRLIRRLGELSGTGQVADKAAAGLLRDLAGLRQHYTGRRPVRVFYEIWHDPLITVSRADMINDVIELCGGRNIFASVAGLTPAISTEAVLAADPEVIISGSMRHAGNKPGAMAEGWKRYPRLEAVRKNRVFQIDADLIHRATPRTVDGAKQMCERIDQVRSKR